MLYAKYLTGAANFYLMGLRSNATQLMPPDEFSFKDAFQVGAMPFCFILIFFQIILVSRDKGPLIGCWTAQKFRFEIAQLDKEWTTIIIR